jgi:hypothetical protein
MGVIREPGGPKDSRPDDPLCHSITLRPQELKCESKLETEDGNH